MAEAKITYEYTSKDRQRIVNLLIKNADNILKQVGERTVRFGYKKVLDICRSTIDAFYGDYTPGQFTRSKHPYKRKKDLYNAYDIGIKDGYQLIVELGYDLMKFNHHQGEEFVYENSFVRGYHGGSFGIDKNGDVAAVPYWRTPGGKFTHWFPPGCPAPRSVSPYNTIKSKIKLYNDTTYRPLQLRELISILQDYRNRLGV